jgi:UDP-N-acetylmuramate dehydrogenase
VREAVLKIRESKGMVLHGHDSESRSAGSFFKNPFLQPGQADIIEEKARAGGILGESEHIPRFAAPSGEEKLSAAWLIDRAGFHKGFISGCVGISSKHSLALINRGNASAREIVDLMKRIQERVRSRFGIELQPEPVFVGFD